MTALPFTARGGAPQGLPALHERRPHRPGERTMRLLRLLRPLRLWRHLHLVARQAAANIAAQGDGATASAGG